jgi:hypothetical protein
MAKRRIQNHRVSMMRAHQVHGAKHHADTQAKGIRNGGKVCGAAPSSWPTSFATRAGSKRQTL